jgi:hypothetical protein
MRILIQLFILFALTNVSAQISFYKLYSGNSYDKGEGMIQMEDSSYLVTGSSGSWDGNSQAFLLKIDSLGNYKWSQQYGGSESESGKRILYNSDLGFYIAGFSNSFGAGDFDAYLVKTDLNGTKIWEKNYGKPNQWERINDAVMALDSGIVMVGESIDMNTGNSDVYIIKTDKNGDTLWTKKLGSVGEDFANSIVKLNNNYLIGGQWFISDSSMVKGFVLKINDLGELLYFDTISHKTGNYSVNDITIGFDRYYIIGNRNLNNSNSEYYGVYDFNGQFLSQYTFVVSGSNTILNQAVYVPNFDRVAIGFQTVNSGTYQDDFDIGTAYFSSDYMYYISASLSTAINNFGLDKVGDLIRTNDGAYAMVGFNTYIESGLNEQNGGNNVFVMKIGKNDVFPVTTDAVIGQLVGIEINSEMLKGKVYPNPFKDEFTIELEGAEDTNATLLNNLGQEIASFNFQSAITYSTSFLSSGTYFLKIGNSVTKLVKLD